MKNLGAAARTLVSVFRGLSAPDRLPEPRPCPTEGGAGASGEGAGERGSTRRKTERKPKASPKKIEPSGFPHPEIKKRCRKEKIAE